MRTLNRMAKKARIAASVEADVVIASRKVDSCEELAKQVREETGREEDGAPFTQGDG